MTLEIYSKDLNQLTTFEKIVRIGKMAREDYELDNAKKLIKSVAEEATNDNLGDLSNGSNFIGVLLKRIAQIDNILSDYANEVLHHPEFQKLEASWRGCINL